ncbi:MAG: sugar phosphate isomerase/epimerase family protein [Planctomycetota bacterium]|nr:sugar phosphate isomerase/epimerase family protein [Planctomycetota bacterium]
MKYGMNLLLWTGDVTTIDVSILEMLKGHGYDGVELPIFTADEKKFAALGKRMKEIGLSGTAVTIRNLEDNPISPDPKIRAKGVELTKAAIDSTAAAGCTHLVGPFHSAIGHFSGAGPTEDEWNWGIDSMRQSAEYAQKVGVILGIECLNRFETYLLNTHAEAARFARQVQNPNCKIMYDTFHSNIEEKSPRAAIKAAADMIAHVHISENDRSTPGAGAVRWDENFDALHEIGYDGWMTVEAFGLALPEISAATKIWRRMFDSEEQLARDAIAFIKKNVAKRWG